jgi:hypothetical protein
MQTKINRDLMAVVALLIIVLSGCASPAPGPPAAAVPSAGIAIDQPPTTDYMRSRIGTPDELSPLAPPEAKNVRKVGEHWTCEVNGRTMIYNNATACWEPWSQ